MVKGRYYLGKKKVTKLEHRPSMSSPAEIRCDGKKRAQGRIVLGVGKAAWAQGRKTTSIWVRAARADR